MILVRHGQSAFNVVYAATGRDPGIRDPELTPEGRRQARRAALVLRHRNVRRILASPYTRTLQTAAIVADALGVPVDVEPLVRERAAFTCDVGTRRSDLSRRWPGLRLDHLDERWWYEPEESEASLAARCGRFRDLMRADADGVAVITHWGFILALTGVRLGNGDMLRFDPATGTASAVAPPPKP